MENGAFAPMEQMLKFPYFRIHSISKGVKRRYHGVRVNTHADISSRLEAELLVGASSTSILCVSEKQRL